MVTFHGRPPKICYWPFCLETESVTSASDMIWCPGINSAPLALEQGLEKNK